MVTDKQKIKRILKNSKHPRVLGQAFAKQFHALIVIADQLTYEAKQPVYEITPCGIVRVSDDNLKDRIWATCHQFSKKKLDDVLYAMKLEIARDPSRCLKADSIKAIAFADDPALTWKRLEYSEAELMAQPISLDDIPQFRDFIALTNHPMGIVLFIGSLLDYLSSREQYLHLHGNGGEGKSTLCDALSELFGDRCVSVTANDLNGPHFGEQLEGTSLVLFRDENNSTFFSGGQFKNLTGDRYRTINPKGKPPRTIVQNFKVIVSSNSEIQITGDEADKRRLISIRFKPMATKWPADWYGNFIASAEKILAYCYIEYCKAVVIDTSIRQAIPTLEENTQAAIDRGYERYEDALTNHKITITGNENDRIPRGVLHDLVLGRERFNQTSVNRLKGFLKRNGVNEVRIGGKHCYTGIKKEPPSFSESLEKESL